MTRTILHILMAFILPASVGGFTVNKHYCGEELRGVSLSTDAGNCLHDVCAHCEDAAMKCRIETDILSSDDQYLPENNQPEIVFAGLPSTENLTKPEQFYHQRLKDLFTENITSHDIHMFQSFRC
ncbi:MAG: hypothetical protein GXO86_06690 [Chlorobi bacterium]|nr:hypothetical protein [Chlorobiota bacterium]